MLRIACFTNSRLCGVVVGILFQSWDAVRICIKKNRLKMNPELLCIVFLYKSVLSLDRLTQPMQEQCTIWGPSALMAPGQLQKKDMARKAFAQVMWCTKVSPGTVEPN